METQVNNSLRPYDEIKNLIPKPSYEYHKGQMGRICVIGGSLQYTGAAYYAAMSSLATGADLVYMICCEGAVPILKSYSPEIIVIPHYLDKNDSIEAIAKWLPRMHTVLIGPGLGIEPLVQNNVISIIQQLKALDLKIPLVVDADGLRILANNPDLVQDYNAPVYLTPNKREYEMLLTGPSGGHSPQAKEIKSSDCAKFGHEVTMIVKGKSDTILDRSQSIECSQPNSWRRCGGQGDLVAGSLATFAHYAQLKQQQEPADSWRLLAGYAACSVVRKSNLIAFSNKGRSMVSTDMLDKMPDALKDIFPDWNNQPVS